MSIVSMRAIIVVAALWALFLCRITYNMESVLQGYNMVVMVRFILNKIISDSTDRGVYMLIVFTLVTTAAAVGVALDTPLPEQDTVPLPEQDGFCTAGNVECLSAETILTTLS